MQLTVELSLPPRWRRLDPWHWVADDGRTLTAVPLDGASDDPGAAARAALAPAPPTADSAHATVSGWPFLLVEAAERACACYRFLEHGALIVITAPPGRDVLSDDVMDALVSCEPDASLVMPPLAALLEGFPEEDG